MNKPPRPRPRPGRSDKADRSLETAVALHRRGRLDRAVAAYRDALEADPDRPATLNNLGVALRSMGRNEEAAAAFRRVLRRDRRHADAHYNLGNALQALGQREEAAASFGRAIRLKPDYAAAYTNLGLLSSELGRHGEALDCLSRALRLEPDEAKVHFNLGVALWTGGKIEAAVACYRRALAIDSSDAQCHHNLALALMRSNELEDAAAHERRAIELAPELVEAHAVLGQILVSLGRLDEGLRAFERALEIDGHNLGAHLGKARALLLKGDLDDGWTEYEWRWKRGREPVREYPKPEWDGSDLAGRTLLLYTEQGLGDTIQFVRYVPLIAAGGGRVVVECQAPLVRLIQRVPDAERVLARGQKPPRFDVHAPMLSLPRIMKTRLDSLPCDIPYFAMPGPPAPNRGAADGGGLGVGIVWAGSPDHENDANRSCALADFLPLLEIPGTKFFSLQKGPPSRQIHELGCAGLVRDLNDRNKDFADAADIMWRLDLVISVDTAAAHLAGALGIPVWMLLPFAPDWRWMLDRKDTPWYPSMRLYRQPRPGAWREVLAEAANDLRALAGAAAD